MTGRKDFLSQPAPENYVAGLGRGATGFTTRSDLGPAREGPTPEQIQEALTKRALLLGAAPPTAYGSSNRGEKGKGDKADKAIEEEEDDRFQDPENEVGLFAYGQYDRDDDEADRIYQEVDEKMDRRRKLRRFVSPFFFSQTYLSNPIILKAVGLSCFHEAFWIDCRHENPFSTLGKLEKNKSAKNTNETTPKSSSNLQTSNAP